MLLFCACAENDFIRGQFINLVEEINRGDFCLSHCGLQGQEGGGWREFRRWPLRVGKQWRPVCQGKPDSK